MVHIESRLAVAHAWPDARFHETQRLGHQRMLRYHRVVQTVIDFLGGRIKFQRIACGRKKQPSPTRTALRSKKPRRKNI